MRILGSTLVACGSLLLVASSSALANGVNQQIQSAEGDFCLDVDGSKTTDGTAAFLVKCHTANNQRFAVTASADKHEIIVGLGGLCVDGKDVGGKNGGLQMWKCNFGPTQKFEIAGDGHIKSEGKCWKATGMKDKAQIVLADCSGDKSETWKLVK